MKSTGSLGFILGLWIGAVLTIGVVMCAAFLPRIETTDPFLQRILVILPPTLMISVSCWAACYVIAVRPLSKICLFLSSIDKNNTQSIDRHSRIAGIRATNDRVNVMTQRLEQLPDDRVVPGAQKKIERIRELAKRLTSEDSECVMAILLETAQLQKDLQDLGRIDTSSGEARMDQEQTLLDSHTELRTRILKRRSRWRIDVHDHQDSTEPAL